MFLGPNARITGGVAARRAFPAGTQLPFIQAVAPVGWVRVATYDDAALRIVGSATPANGGSNGFSVVMAQTGTGTGTTGTGTTGTGTSGSTTLTAAQIPAHTHQYSDVDSNNNWYSAANTGGFQVPQWNRAAATTDSGTGGGGGHTHSLPGLSVPGLSIPSLSVTFGMKYVDALIARKS
jgi:hypothetical protein